MSNLKSMAALAVLALLLVAEPAVAWGPATHIGLAESILDRLTLLPPAVAAILGRHRLAYLYGSIAADIVFAKRLSRIKQFCHHWSTAFRLLGSTRDDRDRSFAYGYLSHLAADTVAHGKFVPRQILLNGGRINFGHIYWELRADEAVPQAMWARLRDLLDENHDQHHCALARHMTETLLVYPLNRMLFDRINTVSARRSFRRTIDFWSRHSRWYLSPKLLEGYQGECLDRIMSILTEGRGSALVREDPNGTSAFMQLRAHRRYLRRLRIRGLPVHGRRREAAMALAPDRSGAEVVRV